MSHVKVFPLSFSPFFPYRQIFLVFCFKNSHSSERTRAHSNVREFVCATVGVDGVEVRSIHIHSSQHQGRTHVTLVPEGRGEGKS